MRRAMPILRLRGTQASCWNRPRKLVTGSMRGAAAKRFFCDLQRTGAIQLRRRRQNRIRPGANLREPQKATGYGQRGPPRLMTATPKRDHFSSPANPVRPGHSSEHLVCSPARRRKKRLWKLQPKFQVGQACV